MPQLHLNQGPQDALLYDNSRSYFTNVGYVRTSNFQLELRDVDPSNNANLGATVQFVIPKSGDLLGGVDLMFNLDPCQAAPGASQYSAWVENVGYAAIERIVFSVGSNDIETITGDQLNVMNELMKSEPHRMRETIGATGRPACYANCTAAAYATKEPEGALSQTNNEHGRLIAKDAIIARGKQFIIPTGLFFTKHPSQYFPLASIAGCNDVRVSIKFRPLNELLQLGSDYTSALGVINPAVAPGASALPTWNSGQVITAGTCKLRCTYVHVTGPEATTLMNKEHVRLMKLWSVNSTVHQLAGAPIATAVPQQISIDLSFLHPVSELLFTIRKVSQMTSSTDPTALITASNQGSRQKAYFDYHGKPAPERGGGTLVGDPCVDHPASSSSWLGKETGTVPVAVGAADDYCVFQSVELSLNGQERQPSLAGTGITRAYMMKRMMPMLHSNTSDLMQRVASESILEDIGTAAVAANAGNQADAWERQSDLQALSRLGERKEIYCYPFALNPEGANPSGAVNFSKVSHAKLTLNVLPLSATSATVGYQVDVYAQYYNWLQIKDGRALLSFA